MRAVFERLRFGPPLVMLALGGMTLAFTAGALWRMIDPLARRQPDGRSGGGGGGARWTRELEREKQLVLKAIKEIEFDYQMRKIAEPDYRDMVERYRTRAMRLISELDAGSDYRALIERELKMRLDLPLPAEPSAATAAPAAAARRRRRTPARAARPSTTTTRSSAKNAAQSSDSRSRPWRSLFAAPMAGAQPMGGGGGMPNLADIVGNPLPDRGMADRDGQRARRAQDCRQIRSPTSRSAPSSATRAAICASAPPRPTPAAARCSKGMAPGDQFTAEVIVDGEKLKTETFTMPQRAASAPC